jgi:hypothetical protein
VTYVFDAIGRSQAIPVVIMAVLHQAARQSGGDQLRAHHLSRPAIAQVAATAPQAVFQAVGGAALVRSWWAQLRRP